MKPDELKAKLQPGPEPKEQFATGMLKPTGQADFVLYFGPRILPDGFDANNNVKVKTVKATNETQALRYLRECDRIDRAMNNLSHGLATPWGFADFMVTRNKAIAKEAEEDGRPVVALMTWTKKAVDALQPEHRDKWKAYKVEDGIWAGFYEE